MTSMPPSKPEKEEEESIGKGEEGTKVHDAPRDDEKKGGGIMSCGSHISRLL